MFNSLFYHSIVKKSVILFGTLFNEIYINREDASAAKVQQIKVPIAYGPKDPFIAKTEEDPNLNRPYSILLPRMAFEIVNFSYASERKLNTLGRLQTLSKTSYQYNPVPYDIFFNLYIAVKNVDDGTRILEQILPFFTPDWTSTVNLMEGYESVDVPLILMQVSSEDLYEASYQARRTIVWTLSFKMQTQFYGPDKSSLNKIIKLADINFYAPSTNTSAEGVGVTNVSDNITITPGLDANGNPTTNSALTIPYQQVNATDNYAYIVMKTSNT